MCAPTASSIPVVDRYGLKLFDTPPPQADILPPPTAVPDAEKNSRVYNDKEDDDEEAVIANNAEPSKWKTLYTDLIFPCLRTPLAFVGL